MQAQTHVIVGGGLAGASAAAALRKEGFEGRIVLLADEAEPPYERPELSKKYLRGEPETKLEVHPADFYRSADIDLRTGLAVERLDVRRRQVVAGDMSIGFDRLLLATGARPRSLDVPGGTLAGVHTLRTRADSDRIREAAAAAGSVVVIGGGWIGSEVAASLRQLGSEVTLVLPETMPLQRVLGNEVGAVYRKAHEDHGVRVISGALVVGFVGRDRVSGVTLKDGRTLSADLVVVGIGAEPRTELARAAGLAVENGILVDERLETTVPGVFAAGDVAHAMHPLYARRIRVEHWDNAKRQGRAAAANMLGRGGVYDRVPYFYSDQYDLGMEYTGFAPDWDEVVFRGRPDDGEFIAFWLKDARVAAAMNVNIWDVAPAIRSLVESRARVDRRQLTDAARPLTDLETAA